MSDSRVGSQFGKYQLVTLLGKGGMGEVYEAYDTDKDRTVALKILADTHAQDERFRARFLRESHAAATVHEPHIIPIHDWGEIDGRLYIDMRLVRGKTLHELATERPLEPTRAVGIIQQISAALDAAHAEGLVHRDVKPQNIIVTSADFAYLVDFGIAEARGDARLTMEGTKVGSLAYMAPERFEEDQSTAAADIYSLACVLYEALTGRTPYPTNSMEQLIASHVSAPPPRASAANPQVTAALDDVIARGMEKEPDDRYGSAGALGRAAQRAIHGVGPQSSAISTSASTMVAPILASTTGTPSQAVTDPTPVGFSATGSMTTTAMNDSSGRQSQVPLLLIGVMAALLLGAVGIVIGLLMSKKDGETTPPWTPSTATVAAPTIPTVPAPDSTATHTVTRTQTAAPAPRIDPNDAALYQLRQIADADRPYVSAGLADVWIPQLSSKRPGTVDDGVVWDNARTLQEFLGLRQRFGAKLLWSGDWSTFSAPNYWVTVAPVTFSSPQGALDWCTAQGFDSWHCLGKLVSTTHPVAGSTATN